MDIKQSYEQFKQDTTNIVKGEGSVEAKHVRTYIIGTGLLVWFITRWLTISSTVTAMTQGFRPGVLPFTRRPIGFVVQPDGSIVISDRDGSAPVAQVSPAAAGAIANDFAPMIEQK